MDKDDFISMLLGGPGGGGGGDSKSILLYRNKASATKDLKKFLKIKEENSQLKVGDFIERNVYGSKHYRFPDASKNEVAIITEVYPDYKVIDDQRQYNAIMAVALEIGIVKHFTIDLAYYKKVDAPNDSTIISLFGSGKKDK